MHADRAISTALGWSYFVVWSLSFWPQALLNWRRKSVVGMSFDFQLVNILGYAAYSAYCVCLRFDPRTRRAYARAFGDENLVATPDVCFALHGFALTALQIGQIAMYDRGTQRLSRVSVAFSAACVGGTAAYAALVVAAPPALPDLRWLDLLYWLSLIKLVVTVPIGA